jgi:ribonucleotide reductase beta subunit family protein with ferritin-like domain
LTLAERPRSEHPTDDELEQHAPSYRALYEHWERNQWSPLEIDLSADARSFEALDEGGRTGLVWIFAHRFHAEFNVARLLAPFLSAAPFWDVQLLIATQTADEHRHLQNVLRIYGEVFGVHGFEAVRELADRNMDVVAETLYARLEHYVGLLVGEPSRDAFLTAVVAYHLLAEGVVARTAQNLSAPVYERFGRFPGLAAGQRLVARDEARHIGIGVTYCREQMKRDPDRTRALVGEIVEDFSAIATGLLATANESMGDLVRSGYGVEPDDFYGEAMRLTGLRLRSIGYVVGESE